MKLLSLHLHALFRQSDVASAARAVGYLECSLGRRRGDAVQLHMGPRGKAVEIQLMDPQHKRVQNAMAMATSPCHSVGLGVFIPGGLPSLKDDLKHAT